MVLGGGDGGVLKELLELSQPPEYITMIELDNEVMKGCAKYMRSVCGSYLDEENRKASNYEVICGDALKYMENAIVSTLIQLNRYVGKGLVSYNSFYFINSLQFIKQRW